MARWRGRLAAKRRCGPRGCARRMKPGLLPRSIVRFSLPSIASMVVQAPETCPRRYAHNFVLPADYDMDIIAQPSPRRAYDRPLPRARFSLSEARKQAWSAAAEPVRPVLWENTEGMNDFLAAQGLKAFRFIWTSVRKLVVGARAAPLRRACQRRMLPVTWRYT